MASELSALLDSRDCAVNYARFLATADAIKRTPRTGWCLRGLSDVEPVACHMWAMAVVAYACLPGWDGCAGADADRLVALCLAHDLAEAVVGDLTPHCGVPPDEKLRREQLALGYMATNLDADTAARLVGLFQEYNTQESWEARLAKELDRLDMCCQAMHYRLSRHGCPCLAEFAVSCLPKTAVPGVATRVRATAAILLMDADGDLSQSQLAVAIGTNPTPIIPVEELSEFARLKEVVLMPIENTKLSLDGQETWRPDPVLLGCHQYMLCLMGVTLPASCLSDLNGRVGAAELLRAVVVANWLPGGSPVFRPCEGHACPLASAPPPITGDVVSEEAGKRRRLLDGLIADLAWLDAALVARAAGRLAAAAAAGLPGRVRRPFLRLVCEVILADDI